MSALRDNLLKNADNIRVRRMPDGTFGVVDARRREEWLCISKDVEAAKEWARWFVDELRRKANAC